MHIEVPSLIMGGVVFLIMGVVLGWNFKTQWLEQYIHTEKVNGHWLVYFGPRIVGRSTDEAGARERKRLLISALHGIKAPRRGG